MNNIEILKAIQKQKPFIVWVDDKPYNKREAIEHLIQENKELKDTNKKLYELCQGKAMQEFINNECGYIHKSKVKEIVELYNNTLQCTRKYNQDLTDILCDLEELLEEGE